MLVVFTAGPVDTNGYVLSDSGEAVIVDPAPGSFGVIEKYVAENGLKVKAVWLTHSHWDHFGDAYLCKKKWGVPVGVHALDARNLEEPGSDGVPRLISVEPVVPSLLWQGGEQLKVGELKVEVIHTPGHSPGGVCFYVPAEKILLSGDTLFQGTIGNISFSTGRPALMWQSLANLAKLPPDTKVFPGHGLSTTIGKEKWLERAEEIFG